MYCMSLDLDIVQLRTLLAVVEEGSFSAAAEKVGRTQSAVTQQLQKLEAVAGQPLFRANGRQRELTPAGWTLARYAREIVSMSRHALSALEEAATGGVLRVGVPRELTDAAMAKVIARFYKARPDIRLVLHVDRSPNLMTMLQESRLEIAVTTRRQPHLDGKHICALQPVWLAAPRYRWKPQMPLPLLLTDEPSLYRRITLQALDISGIAYVERFTSPSLSGLRPAILAGLGVTARPSASFGSKLKVLETAEGFPALPKVSYYAYARDVPAQGYIDNFFDALDIVSELEL
jgi:DNA-binding transcriptional LysR family regulator